MTAGFTATARDGGEKVALSRARPSRLPFGKPTAAQVPFDDWLSAAPPGSTAAIALVLQAVGDGELASDGRLLASVEAGDVLLHPAFVARLPEAEARALGFPPATPLALDLRSSGLVHRPEFRIEPRWVRLGGMPARAIPRGARLLHDGAEHRLPEPIYSAWQAVSAVNAAEDEARRQEALARLKGAIGEDAAGRVATDGVIDGLRLAYAASFSLSLSPSSAGFDFDPVLFSREQAGAAADGDVLDEGADSLLPPEQARDFAQRFRGGDGRRRAYLLSDGSILFIDPGLARALTAVRGAQRGGIEARKDFASNPARAIARAFATAGEEPQAADTLFIETQQFSARVQGIDVWRQPVLPWIKPKPNTWLPEKFGLRVGEEPDARIVELAPADLPSIEQAVTGAVAEERATFSWQGQELPATGQAQQAISDLAALVADAASRNERTLEEPPASADKYFLQVADNFEALNYAPLAPAQPAVDLPPPEWPAAVVTTPKPHQREGFAWLIECWRSALPGALLADDMGLGKTYQALTFLAWVRGEEPGKPILIVAPTGLLANWRAEIERHLAPDALGPVMATYGRGLAAMREGKGRDIEVGASRLAVDSWAAAGVVLTTYETMRDHHFSFARQPFSVIIYDEAQKLKNPASQMTRAAKTLNGGFQLAMTGTPVENRLQDLWSIYEVVHPSLLGTSKAFEEEYPADRPDRLRTLSELLTAPSDRGAPSLLRRMKSDCLDGLPAKQERKLPQSMPPAQAEAYDRVVARAMVVKESRERGRMLEMLQHLRGVSLHPRAPEDAGDGYFEDSARTRQLFIILDEVAARREKALVFCESLAMQALVAAEIKRRYRLAHQVARIHGGVAGEARQRAVDEFQARGDGFDAMILSPKAGGVGLTLTAANHVIHLSRWWNPAVEDQATDRVFRIGQTRDVVVYIPQAAHPAPALKDASFDLRLDELMRRKRALSGGLFAPVDDEADAAALFDEVVAPAPSEPAQPVPAEVVPARVTLSVKPAPPATTAHVPSRVSFRSNRQRDFAIFLQPLAGARVQRLVVVDPYACAHADARAAVVDFIAMLAGGARAIEAVEVITWDADSASSRLGETDRQQRDDFVGRWRRRFGERALPRLVSRSKRRGQQLHDRSVRAELGDGRALLWDLGGGVDRLMNERHECVVNFSSEDRRDA